MGNIYDHAKRELELLGEEEFTVKGYLNMIKIFEEMNHSGGSASVFIPTLTALLQFKNLKPLTNNPDEWMLVGRDMFPIESDVWQSIRNPEAFSNDGGLTYYLLSEGANAKNRKPIHTSEDG